MRGRESTKTGASSIPWDPLPRLLSFFLLLIQQIVAHETEFQWREPYPVSYEWIGLDKDDPSRAIIRRKGSHENRLSIGNQLVVHFFTALSEAEIETMLPNETYEHIEKLSARIHLLATSTPRSCVELVEAFSRLPEVEAVYPNARRRLQRLRAYAKAPNDPYFTRQWYLENRDLETAAPTGVDVNVRGAWPLSRGHGVTVAIADDGIELTHPDLIESIGVTGNRNFTTGSSNGSHRVIFHAHGTAVAGIVAARGNDDTGMIGVAPEASLASWVIFDTNDSIVDAVRLSQMFGFENDAIPVQNHSWGNGLVELLGPPLIEEVAISNAVYHARSGRGVVMVRAAGNSREAALGHPGGGDTNDDGYASYPGVIAVAAVDESGRAATYSSPGASILIAVPGGENDRTLFTTDRLGNLGFNPNAGSDTGDLSNYAFGENGFVGTSAAAPIVSGICALILSTNPNLTVRDVQQILILSSIHHDLDDPGLQQNGAGLWVSHNVGFGVPNTAQAVYLAKGWPLRPPLAQISRTSTLRQSIPDDALFVEIMGKNLPLELTRIPANSGQGLAPDDPTMELPLVDLGRALTPVDDDLTGKAALIERGETLFSEKITHAADAGAEFVVLYNNVDGDRRIRLGGTYYSEIPAFSIGEFDGQTLVQELGVDPTLSARLIMDSAERSFTIENSILCEHVGLRVKTNHNRRGDLRITLESPSGTRSILQNFNSDDASGPNDWIYYSVQHFYEQAQGEWAVAITDSGLGNMGEILELELIIRGVDVVDSDRDSLDDAWELRSFGNLNQSPKDDPDQDGLSNLIEQILSTNPSVNETPLMLELSPWNDELARLSWPSVEGVSYDLMIKNSVSEKATLLHSLKGRPYESEFFVPTKNLESGFYQLLQTPQ